MQIIDKIKDWLCPSRINLKIRNELLQDSLDYQADLLKRLQKLEDVVSHNKTIFADTTSKLAITSHAIHRYRERHKGQGSDDEISKMLFKLLLKQLYIMDTLPDGDYNLKKGVVGVIQNNTLVTVLPKRAARPQAKFK